MSAEIELPAPAVVALSAERLAELRVEAARLMASVAALAATHLTFDHDPSTYLAELHRQARRPSDEAK
ncbi:hypothetical protein, partial [Acinetobacter baumannii]|uniref:hypothetical protein n=1 Tax=Acinetobacter baumannii TaxID=470 RepID=UPI0013D59C45